MTDQLPRLIRPYRSDDLSFILSSWCRSYSESPNAAWVPRRVFMRVYHDYIERLLSLGQLDVQLAVDPDNDEQIYGWSALSSGVVHYVYVKQLYRTLGVANELIAGHCPGSLIRHSHWTRACSYVVDRLVYEPHSFFTASAIEWMQERGRIYDSDSGR